MINVIIPAAGEATRLRPITSNMSKAMVPVNGKPVIDYILEYLDDYSAVAEIVIVYGRNDDLPTYISNKYPNSNIKLVNQPQAIGPVNAIYYGAMELDEPEHSCMVWLGDTIIQEELPIGDDFLAVSRDVEDQSEWCIFDGDMFYNKPERHINNGAALIGVYSFADGKKFEDALSLALHTQPQPQAEISDIIAKYNKPMNIVGVDEWYDMGNFRTYYETSAKLLTHKARDFNSIDVDTFFGTLKKTSHEASILIPEIKWYESLSQDQKLFTPTIISSKVEEFSDMAAIEMTLETGVLLSDLLVYDNLPITTWEYLLDKIFKIMHGVFYEADTPNQIKLTHMYSIKSANRLKDNEFFTDEEIAELQNIAHGCSSHVYAKWSKIIHGDLHTGNIIFEPISGKMKLIDPRGDFGGDLPCTEGDQCYDMYKLAHDLYWGYNHMLAGIEYDREDIKKLFVSKLEEYGYKSEQILRGGLLLLATCIPLHEEDPDRQKRFADKVKNNL